LLKFLRAVTEIIGHRNDAEEIERERERQETKERGNFQAGLGWTYMDRFVPVVSEDWNTKYERRKEIIRKGTWNVSRKGWEYDGDFAGIWG
jgi:hypothetical protein